VQPEYANLKTSDGEYDVFSMVIRGFCEPYVSGVYLLGLALLAFHLSHGVGSLFQTLGVSNQRSKPIFSGVGYFVAWILFAGYASIPIAILFFRFGIGLAKQ